MDLGRRVLRFRDTNLEERAMIQIPRMSIFAAGTLLLLACSREVQAPENNVMDASAGDAEDGSRRTFSLAGGDGAELGSVTVQENVRGLSMTVAARAMAVGAHGLHLHQKGLCDGPKFESAGPH